MIVNLPPALTLNQIAYKGDLTQERVHLLVARDCNLANYLLMATVEMMPGQILAGSRPAYWFSAQEAKKGDHVVVYTREGTDSKGVRLDGHVNHFFFWGAKNQMFAGLARVVVVELNTWQTGT